MWGQKIRSHYFSVLEPFGPPPSMQERVPAKQSLVVLGLVGFGLRQYVTLPQGLMVGRNCYLLGPVWKHHFADRRECQVTKQEQETKTRTCRGILL